jgi:hypothetical protein
MNRTLLSFVIIFLVISAAVINSAIERIPHGQAKAAAYDRMCRRVTYALHAAQVDLQSRALHDSAIARIGRDPGVTFDEITNCLLLDPGESDEAVAPLSACLEKRDDGCLDRELTALRSKVRGILAE